MLQEIITSMPDVSLVGSKPSNIYVTLSGPTGKAAGVCVCLCVWELGFKWTSKLVMNK
jgi:hypothetical protein